MFVCVCVCSNTFFTWGCAPRYPPPPAYGAQISKAVGQGASGGSTPHKMRTRRRLSHLNAVGQGANGGQSPLWGKWGVHPPQNSRFPGFHYTPRKLKEKETINRNASVNTNN